MTPRTKLGWVIFEKRQNTNKYPNINAFSKEFDPENTVSKILQIESYGVLEKQKPNILPQTEQHALNVLEKTTTNTNNPHVVGILWDGDNVELPGKKNFAPSSFLS